MAQHQNHISEEADDRLYEQALFGTAGDTTFLGDPAVVGQLVANYLQQVRTAIEQRAAGVLHVEGFVDEIRTERDKYAAIFRGDDPAYAAMAGWNAVSLPIRLKADLGEFWQAQRAACDNDPVKCLFAWLCWAMFDAVRTADGDPDLESEIVAERARSAIQLLLGTAPRA